MGVNGIALTLTVRSAAAFNNFYGRVMRLGNSRAPLTIKRVRLYHQEERDDGEIFEKSRATL